MSQSNEEEINELRSVVAKLQGQVRSLMSPEARKEEEADTARKQAARAKLAEADEMIALGKAQRAEALAELGLADVDAEEEEIAESRRKKGSARAAANARTGDEKRARIRDLVDDSRGLFIEEIASATGFTKSSVWTHVSKLESLGHVWTEQNVHNPKTGRSTGTKVYPRSIMRKRRR